MKGGFHFLIVFLSITFHGRNVFCSSGTPVKDPVCSTTQFYCPYGSTHDCRPRSARCLLESQRTKQSCLNPQTHQEEGCRGNLKTGVFEIWSGWKLLGSSSSTSKRAAVLNNRVPAHEFVTYRGFTYEYGPKGVNISDINDPNYRYKNNKNVYRPKKEGTSSCKMNDLSPFTSKWKGEDYKLLKHNCQCFANELIKFLKGNCPKHISQSLPNCEILTEDNVKKSDGNEDGIVIENECSIDISNSAAGFVIFRTAVAVLLEGFMTAMIITDNICD